MSGADTALKEVIQTDKILGFSFISNLDVFDLSHVSLSEHKCQDPRCASGFFCCWSINILGGCSNLLRQLKTKTQWKDSNHQILAYCQLL